MLCTVADMRRAAACDPAVEAITVKMTAKFPPCATPGERAPQRPTPPGRAAGRAGSATQPTAIAADTAATGARRPSAIGTAMPPTMPNSWNSAAAPPDAARSSPRVSCSTDGSQALTA